MRKIFNSGNAMQCEIVSNTTTEMKIAGIWYLTLFSPIQLPAMHAQYQIKVKKIYS